MNSVPLTDVLPWGDTIPTGGRTILICDSASVGGRFLLHTMAAQCLRSSSSSPPPSSSTSTNICDGTTSRTVPSNPIQSSSSQSFRRNNDTMLRDSKQQAKTKNGKVLWIHCGCSTDDQLRLALKKAGCDSASISSNTPQSLHFHRGASSSVPSQFEIINIMHDLSEHYCTLMEGNGSTQEKKDDVGDKNLDDTSYQESYVKSLYFKVKQWVKESAQHSSTYSNPLIILDNVSLLSNQVGYQLTHTLIQKIQNIMINEATSSTSANKEINKGIGCLAMLCSHDFDQEYYLNSTQQSQRNTNVTGGKIMQYIGGGGRGILCNSEELAILNQQVYYEFQHVWERSLVELSDGIIDVVPLASGFARDVHGRLVFTERSGSLGWKDGNETQIYNTGSSSDAERKISTSTRNKKIGMSTEINSFSTSTVNFCCHDNGVRAIRLRI
mmetsp:Transcript_8230/g.12391  ORF Transcript_8230/g.12391 Transcript_8230/m.12391 type:complete len:440 (-) Transcript_8230:46-1365(-)